MLFALSGSARPGELVLLFVIRKIEECAFVFLPLFNNSRAGLLDIGTVTGLNLGQKDLPRPQKFVTCV